MHVRAIHHNKRLLRPKRRPPRPQQPIFSVFHRGGLHFERHTASSRGFTATKRECCIIRTPTRRQTSPHSVKSHRHRCGEHGQIGRAWLRCRWAAAGPGWDTHSNDEPHWCGGYRRNWRACCGARGRRRDLDGIRTVTTNPTGVEDTGGIGGPAAVPVGGGGTWMGYAQ